MSIDASNPAPIAPVIAPNANPLPPVEQVADGGGVEPQSGADDESIGAQNGEAQNRVSNLPENWPEWAPAPPTDIPPPPWEVEGRRPRPDELIPQLDQPARSPMQYTIPDGMLGDTSDPEALVNGRALQSLLWSAGMPAHEGAGLLQAIADAGRNANPDMDPVSMKLRIRETEGMLKRQLGEEVYTRQRDALTAMLADMDAKSGGKLAELLDMNSVALTDPMVRLKLMSHADRAATRRRR